MVFLPCRRTSSVTGVPTRPHQHYYRCLDRFARRYPAGVPDESGGDPVGYTMLLHGEPSDPDVARAIHHRPTVEMVCFYVHPGHHGSGTAGLLMEHTLAAADATEARGAWLGVSEENARANAFYARHGFEPVGRKRSRIGETWEDDVVRERVLRTP